MVVKLKTAIGPLSTHTKWNQGHLASGLSLPLSTALNTTAGLSVNQCSSLISNSIRSIESIKSPSTFSVWKSIMGWKFYLIYWLIPIDFFFKIPCLLSLLVARVQVPLCTSPTLYVFFLFCFYFSFFSKSHFVIFFNQISSTLLFSFFLIRTINILIIQFQFPIPFLVPCSPPACGTLGTTALRKKNRESTQTWKVDPIQTPLRKFSPDSPKFLIQKTVVMSTTEKFYTDYMHSR